MNRFQLCLLFTLLLFFAPTNNRAIQTSFPSPASARSQQVFRPSVSAPSTRQARVFDSEKRKVPTGSNPLHNKR
ncbi:hypothetical protein CerSpe_123550 [Prunus speciosa]